MASDVFVIDMRVGCSCICDRLQALFSGQQPSVGLSQIHVDALEMFLC